MREKESSRERTIVRAGVVGITANVLLSVFKVIVGTMANSIAIVMDALNNLTDTFSSTITIVGAKLGARKPDKEHPFGHGRYEYVSAFIIAVLILYAGVTALIESVKKIINPATPDYTTITLIVVSASILVKIALGIYFNRKAKEAGSDALANSGKDAMMDVVISASTLIAALFYMWKGISIDSWLAAVIALVIIKAGISMIHETISRLLGERADSGLAMKIRETAMSYPSVLGVYDLVLNNYGPGRYYGSLHIEVPDTLTVSEIDELSRSISTKVQYKYGVTLTAVGIYSKNTKNKVQSEVESNIRKFCLSTRYVLQVHGFFMDGKDVRFDIVVSFDAPDRNAVYREVVKGVRKMYPDYKFQIVLDSDYSDVCSNPSE